MLKKLLFPGYHVAKYINEHSPGGSLRKSFVDNVIKDKVMPQKGAILHCSLYGVEHTGVYIGNNKIVELLGNGDIRIATPSMFLSGTNAISIYVACNGTIPLGSEGIAKRAEEMVGNSRKYNIILDNCHQFTAGCILGDYENADNFFLFVESTIKEKMNGGKSIEWRVWDYK